MNILVIGTGEKEQAIIKLCLKSKLLDKIFTASNNPLEDIPNVEYSSFEDLASKAKILQIDIAILLDTNLINEGIVDIFKKNLINLICTNKKWLNLETSRLIAKQLANHYTINTPEIIKAPVAFPIVVKTDYPESKKIAYSIQELIKIREEFAGKKVFLEEYLNGEEFSLISLWDGKNFAHFNTIENLNEVQEDRLQLYKTKLSFMLSDEKTDFIGFIISKLIWAKNDWYLLSYRMTPNINELNSILNHFSKDFLYLLNAAIYQKLNEIPNK